MDEGDAIHQALLSKPSFKEVHVDEFERRLLNQRPQQAYGNNQVEEQKQTGIATPNLHDRRGTLQV